MGKTTEMKYLFEPRSVAIIGASSSPDKIGYKIVENIKASGYKGKVFPINPKGGEILGYEVFPNIEDVKDDIDIAVISIPAKFVFDSLSGCAKKRVKFLLIIASGFSEIGNLEEEQKIVQYARQNGMRVLGPNIFGIFSASAPINATFGPKYIKSGSVAIITQSGALGVAMIGKTSAERIGLSAIVSVGNKSDIDEADLLEYLGSHKDTKVILMYIEGVKNGEKLISALYKVTKVKPVIAIKAGRSKRGAIAAASHTGSLAGSDEIFSDVMKQCGVLRAETIQEALNWSKFLATSPKPKGEDAVIITNGGGVGVIATDACEKFGVNLYDNLNDLKVTFSEVVPQFGSVKNPVDLTGQATILDYEKALQASLKSKSINSIICLFCETATFDANDFIGSLKNLSSNARFTKPVAFALFGGEKVESAVASLKREGFSAFTEVYEAVSSLGALYSHYRIAKELASQQSAEQELQKLSIDMDAISEIINIAKQEKRSFLFQNEAQAVMKAAGIRTPKTFIAKSLEEAVLFAERIGYPVVMKVVSRDILHKSDVGGVMLDLQTKEEVIDAYQVIMHNCKRRAPSARIDGIEIAEMIKGGVEVIAGARRDGAFGPIVMFGLGGKYVEVMKDVSFRAFPLTKREALKMISETKAYSLLLGTRGEERKDISSLIDAILKVGTILCKSKDISDIEINPLLIYDEGEGACALDIRVMLKPQGD